MNYFEELNSIDVNAKIEKKNGLSYLSWAWAWGELKKKFPNSFYTVYENNDGWNYFTDGKTCWVKTGITVSTDSEEIEHIEYLPVMDYRNKSIPADNVTSFDVNKAIQRSLTKAIARHGLGLYIYAGEDLPEAGIPDAVIEPKGSSSWQNIKDETAEPKQITEKEAKLLIELCARTEPPTDVQKMCKAYKVKSLDLLDEAQYGEALAIVKKRLPSEQKKSVKVVNE